MTERLAERLGCDIIMRGGITSGLVYPGAISTLARHYDFRNIGGASAGAIAAGITAAAQFGRNNGRPDVFDTLIPAIPGQLGGRSTGDPGAGEQSGLRRLFTPHPRLAPILSLALALKAGTDAGRSLPAALWAMVGPHVRRRAGLALAGGFGAAFLLLLGFNGIAHWFSGPAGMAIAILFLAIIGTALALLIFTALLAVDGQGLATMAGEAGEIFKANGFGLGAGVNPALTAETRLEEMVARGHLSDWLHGLIQQAANLPSAEPLTMAHLWGGEPDRGPWTPNRRIDLILTTTNLSQQLPHQFPFLERVQSYLYFREADLKPVLPPTVLAWMVNSADPLEQLAVDGEIYHRLPPARKLPVMLGVRMSLSFPGLVSAIRFYETCRWEADAKDSAKERARALSKLRPCWFSDGGITSNFPVTAFDAPLPNWPTFCINLADLGPDDNPNHRIAMPGDNSDFVRARHQGEIGGIGAFLGAIVSTARNAQENELQTVPGQRDRIATVLLNPAAEGGLNLDMDDKVIAQLDDYGKAAGERLLQRFHPDGGGDAQAPKMNWANHRWLRLRSTLAGMEALLVRFDAGWRDQQPHQPDYPTILAESDKPAGYDWGANDARDWAQEQAGKLAEFARDFAATPLIRWPQEGYHTRPEGSLFNGRRKDRDAGPDSLSRRHNAPLPPMGYQLRALSRDPRKG